jgi:hypothetical protein
LHSHPWVLSHGLRTVLELGETEKNCHLIARSPSLILRQDYRYRNFRYLSFLYFDTDKSIALLDKTRWEPNHYKYIIQLDLRFVEMIRHVTISV